MVRILDALARVRAEVSDDFTAVLAGHRNYLPQGCMVAAISPDLRPELVGSAQAWLRQGYAVTWMVLEARDRGSQQPWELTEELLAARMTQRGMPAYIIEPGRPLAMSLRRTYRAAS